MDIMILKKTTPKDMIGIICFLGINMLLLIISAAIPGSMTIGEQSICRSYFLFQIVINVLWLMRYAGPAN